MREIGADDEEVMTVEVRAKRICDLFAGRRRACPDHHRYDCEVFAQPGLKEGKLHLDAVFELVSIGPRNENLVLLHELLAQLRVHLHDSQRSNEIALHVNGSPLKPNVMAGTEDKDVLVMVFWIDLIEARRRNAARKNISGMRINEGEYILNSLRRYCVSEQVFQSGSQLASVARIELSCDGGLPVNRWRLLPGRIASRENCEGE